MSSPRIVRLEKSRLLILPGQTVNGCGAVWPSEFFTTLLGRQSVVITDRERSYKK